MGKKKKDGVKIPKRIAGIKLPKDLRRTGEALIEQVQGPAGRAVLAKGVSVMAGLAATAAQAAAVSATRAAAEAKHTPPVPPVPPVPPKPEPSSPAAPPDAVAQAVGAGVEAVLGRLFPKR